MGVRIRGAHQSSRPNISTLETLEAITAARAHDKNSCPVSVSASNPQSRLHASKPRPRLGCGSSISRVLASRITTHGSSSQPWGPAANALLSPLLLVVEMAAFADGRWLRPCVRAQSECISVPKLPRLRFSKESFFLLSTDRPAPRLSQP